MIKTISKVGNSQGIIFDAALMDLARIKVGDQLPSPCTKRGRLCSRQSALRSIPPRRL